MNRRYQDTLIEWYAIEPMLMIIALCIIPSGLIIMHRLSAIMNILALPVL